MATIDVLLPVKNGINFLTESLDSICEQSFKDWRLLVLDHGSTDGSRELATEYQERDRRVEVYAIPEADGLAGLLNRGLDMCDCKYVMRHDADDIAYSSRMDLALTAFQEHQDAILVGGQADMIDASGKNIGSMTVPLGRTRVAAASFFRNPIIHPATMMDYSALDKLGGRYGVDFLNLLPAEQQIEVKGLAEDYFMFGQLALMGKCVNIPAKLIKYRLHGGNVSATRFEEQMKVSLSISRYLVRSFCEMHDVEYFDPAPFCNLGGAFFDVDERYDFSAEFDQMADVLRHVLGTSEEMERELAFRKVAATRRTVLMLWRYLNFQSHYSPETGEWNAVRSWLLRGFPGKASLRVKGVQGKRNVDINLHQNLGGEK